MKIAIIGGNGRIGRTLYKIFAKKSHYVISLDIEDRILISELDNMVDLIFLAVPSTEAVKFIEQNPGARNFVELSSVKEPFKKYSGTIVSIHPLFGPMSADPKGRKQIAFINDISREGSCGLVRELFSDFDVLSLTADEHDKAMANLLVSPYLLSIISKRLLKADTFLLTNSFRRGIEFSSLIDNENPRIVNDTISLNPYAKDVFHEIQQHVENIMKESL